MGALDAFLASGIRFELLAGNQVRAIGVLTDALRADIKAAKSTIVSELQWAEFESLLAIVAPAYNTPQDECEMIRELARGDLLGALVAYREIARQVKHSQHAT